MNNSVFGKIMEIVRKHRGIKLVTTNIRSFQVAEPITQQNGFQKIRKLTSRCIRSVDSRHQ